jgi:methionyl-tRNA synthetase
MDKKPFYITTTLPYVNAPLHMGHALEFVRADTIARYKKLAGFDVFFNTGTDEHGVKIYNKAVEAGLTTQEFVDKGFATFKDQLVAFGVSEDIHFIRTTDSNHIMIAQDFWRRVRENGFIYKKTYQAKYCIGCESEKTDSELDEQGFCPLHPGIALELIDEENYFFKYSAFSEQILALYEKRPDFIIPEFRQNEMREFARRGLQDFSISRLATKMPWGIPVPDDESQVMYVWFDALTNYISTLADEGIDTLDALLASQRFQDFWVNGTPTQYCGKDNTRFQGIMWQAMLMAAKIPNTHQVVVNGFITGDGGIRMSKTLGNVVDPRDIVAEFGTDALRYFLLREVSSFEDSPFTRERFLASYNAGLANGIGNLTSRIMQMAETNLEKPVSVLDPVTHIDNALYHDAFSTFNIQAVMINIWTFVSSLDLLIQTEQPFKLIKEDREKGLIIIEKCVLELWHIAILLEPCLPETSEKMKSAIKVNKKPETPLFARI